MVSIIAITILALVDPASSNTRDVASRIHRLGDVDYHRRSAASEQLFKIGEAALPALRQQDKARDLEIRYRSKVLIRRIMVASGKSRSTGMTLELIDPGEFVMGSPPGESGRRPDESQHRVRITRPFLLGRFEVTQDEFHAVLKRRPSWFAPEGEGKVNVRDLKTGRFPVENITWFDAIEFCNALSKNDGYPEYYRVTNVRRKDGSVVSADVTIRGGNGYRLPTEAEWEFACRAGSQTPFHFGTSSNGRLANVQGVSYTGYGGRVNGPNLKRTTTVGSYKPNALGLYDMHGNVAEWCWDWYVRDYPAPVLSLDPSGPKTGDHRVLRGGSWLVTEPSTRSASRLFHIPQERKYYTGFRVARTP